MGPGRGPAAHHHHRVRREGPVRQVPRRRGQPAADRQLRRHRQTVRLPRSGHDRDDRQGVVVWRRNRTGAVGPQRPELLPGQHQHRQGVLCGHPAGGQAVVEARARAGGDRPECERQLCGHAEHQLVRRHGEGVAVRWQRREAGARGQHVGGPHPVHGHVPGESAAAGGGRRQQEQESAADQCGGLRER